MFNSVRIRLTLWYVAAMSLVLVILAAGTYAVFEKNFIRKADADAVELANSFLATVRAELRDADGDKPEEGIAAAMSEHRFRDVVFVVFDAKGTLRAVSESEREGGTALNRTPAEAADSLRPLLAKSDSFRTIRMGDHRYRSYVRHYAIEGDSGDLIVLQSMHRQHEFLETLAGAFGVVIPLAIFLAGAGGYFLARRSLSPVVMMSDQASRIGAENLHERLKVENPGDELGRLAVSFNQLLDRLDASFEKQRRFVADASHELRTPVAILTGEAEVTLSQPARTEQEYRESLGILRDEAARLRRIVEDLFTLARADAGQHPLAVSGFYLDELLAECCKNVRTLASAKQLSLHCDAEHELPFQGDETLLRRMILNLLDNAIKYTPRGGSLILRCVREGDQYRLSLDDTGPGVPEELRSKIFERFFRADKARSRDETASGGAGLGLAIASWIAAAHNGKLELSQSGPNGSTFTVILPVSAA